MPKSVVVRSGDRLDGLVALVGKTLESHTLVDVCALENAMVVALDAARVVTSPSKAWAEMVSLQTSYVDVMDKVTGKKRRRCKVVCSLRRTTEFEQFLHRRNLQERSILLAILPNS